MDVNWDSLPQFQGIGKNKKLRHKENFCQKFNYESVSLFSLLLNR